MAYDFTFRKLYQLLECNHMLCQILSLVDSMPFIEKLKLIIFCNLGISRAKLTPSDDWNYPLNI